ncbi:carbohydrate ABC transporter permease [Arthrobacter sp. AZCC_0090]|uniref:carbohydrate ABC transporter permease n=1 Tax=Arthrobacter sp. AZCC_0090 TaxID=2735881 RepID=UPI001619B573|nr:sugar ABC transporter permease [Arthrobacter sp. AZCC_0090]MBB6406398.1 multiple sugar transport system permease protein [Arthrobacter sp. AZCC_0090]
MTSTSIAESVKRARRGVGPAGAGRKPGPAPAARARKRFTPRTWTLIAFAAPSLILLLLLNVYPLVYALIQALHDGTLLETGPFVGLKNFGDVLAQPSFWSETSFTVVFTVVGVFGSWLVGLALSLLLRTHIPAGGLFKVLLLLPWIVPTVVSATSWNWLVATPQSPLPVIAEHLGFGNVLFLADPMLAQVVVCLFKVWISFPFMMMMMSSALASVDTNVYEAAKVDGATGWQSFRLITLPLIARTTFVSWILMTIFCVNDFPTIFLLTGGGPAHATTSLVLLAYLTVFQNFQTGPGVAIAFLMTFVLVVISVVLYRQIRKVNVE